MKWRRTNAAVFSRPPTKPLILVLLALVTAAAVQRYWANEALRTRRDRQIELLAEATEGGEARLRKEIAAGMLWKGRLHEDTAVDGHVRKEVQPASVRSAGAISNPRSFGSGPVRLNKPHEFFASLRLHECTPESPDCASGGSLRVTDGEGAELFDCRVQLLAQTEQNQSDYELNWSMACAKLSAEEKLRLLERIAGEGPAPDRRGFLESLRKAYGYDDAGGPSRESLESQVVTDIVRAIVEDVKQTAILRD